MQDRKHLKHDVLKEIVKQVARLGTCRRSKVGALIVRDGRIISTGYNGSPPGELHCLEAGCVMADGHCTRCTHAESNAIAFAAQSGLSTRGATLLVYGWVTGGGVGICHACNKLAKAAGIVKTIIVPIEEGDVQEKLSTLVQKTSQLAVKMADCWTLPTNEFEKKYRPIPSPGSFRDEAAQLVQELSNFVYNQQFPTRPEPEKKSRFDESHNCEERGCVNAKTEFQNEASSNLPDDSDLKV